MGLQPCVKDMPIRITKTDPKNKSVLFKNRRCRLVGWRLREEDIGRLENCSMPGMKLEHSPLELFVRMPQTTWARGSDLGPGVIAIKPTAITWYLDKAPSIF